MTSKMHEERNLDQTKTDMYKVFSYFIVCGFIGWIFETSVVFFTTGKLTDRGLLFIEKDFSFYFNFLNNVPYIRSVPIIWGLPLIEIYGFGGCIIVLLIGRLKHNTLHLFFVGFILMSLLELIASYFCDYILHQTYWDYSNEIFNFQGRICLRSSLAWGGLTVFSIKYLKIKLEYIYEKERFVRHYKIISIFFMIYTILCILFKIFVFK
jgi:uncharacterized membrane protein